MGRDATIKEQFKVNKPDDSISGFSVNFENFS